MASVAILSPNDDLRLLLRGLVRMGRHTIAGEGRGVEALATLPVAASGASFVVLADVDLESPNCSATIQAFATSNPNVRIVLLTPARSARISAAAQACGVTCVVHRPFAIHELMVAIAPLPDGPAPPPAPSGAGRQS